METSLLEAGIALIKQVGFPAVVALWFMFRTDRYIDENTKALKDLREEILRQKP